MWDPQHLALLTSIIPIYVNMQNYLQIAALMLLIIPCYFILSIYTLMYLFIRLPLLLQPLAYVHEM
jgi:hypothetical protein